MKHLTFMIVLAAVASPTLNRSAWAADGFSYTDLNAAARAPRPDPVLADARERLAQTDVLRAAFVLDPARAWRTLSPTERRELFMAFGGQRPLGDEAVQWFMRGASGNAGAGDMTGLYNPLADAWLLLRWQRIGGSLRIRDAAFVPGTMVRDSADPAAWTQSTAPYADALAQSTALARAGFTTLSPDLFFEMVRPLKAAAGNEAFTSVTAWMASLRPWGEDRARMDQWHRLHKQLAEGRAGDTLALLPLRVRASLIPAGALTTDSGTSLLLVSPLAPQLIVAADYRAKGRPDLSLVNLANARLEAAQ